MSSPDNPLPSFPGDFLDKSEYLLRQLNTNLVQLDEWVRSSGEEPREPRDAEPRNEMFRPAHGVNDQSEMMGLEDINALTHRIESVFDAVRELLAGNSSTPPAVNPPPSLLERLDAAVAELRDRIKASSMKRVARETGIAVSTLRRIRDAKSVNLATLRCVAGQLDQPGKTDQSDSEKTKTTQRREREAPTAKDVSGEGQFTPDSSTVGVKAAQVREEHATSDERHSCNPPADKVDQRDSLAPIHFPVTSTEPLQRTVEELSTLSTSGVQQTGVEPLVEQTPTLPDADSAKPVSHEPAVEESQRRPAAADTTSPTTQPLSENAASTPRMGQPASDGAAARMSSPPTPAPMTKQGEVETTAPPAETVRVDIEQLDQLMDLTGQLVMNKSRFSQIGEQLQETLQGEQATEALDRVFRELDRMSAVGELRSDDRHLQYQLRQFQTQTRRIHNELQTVHRQVKAASQARKTVKDLLEAISQFDWVSKSMQRAVMDTRMVPIGPLFTQFNQVIGDIARDDGKDIRLEIQGENTELDKRMIDGLSEPLTHIVRNSANHGIELPEVREAAGKPRQGTVTLEAFHRGNSIVIRVGDDGKGLDTSRIAQQCVALGILTEADTENMTRQQIQQMIWTPGMSTAENVTDASGRGAAMGMDVVKSTIEGLNGSIDLESNAQRGTTLTIKLPLTLAILPSLMVTIGGDIFAMPVDAVTEIVQVGPEQLGTAQGKRVASVRGRLVSLVKLHDTLSFHRNGRRTDPSARQEHILVVVGEGEQELGLVVDHVIGKQDVVVKSIAENYKHVPGISGAHILGDGRVSLILDIPTLIEMAGKPSLTKP